MNKMDLGNADNHANIMDRQKIISALGALNERLKLMNVRGEIGIYGGAVMCLAFNARHGTQDIDAIFVPKSEVMTAASLVGEEMGLPPGWFNDGVKRFISENNDMELFERLSHLDIYLASAEYMFAMKSVSCRTDNENEMNDMRFLAEYLNISNAATAEIVICKYYPEKRILPKTRVMLLELLGG